MLVRRHCWSAHRPGKAGGLLIDQDSFPAPAKSVTLAKRRNDVLGVELQAEGQVRLRLLTAGTLAISENTSDCLGCDEGDLVQRVTMAAGPLLDRCSGGKCGVDSIETELPFPDDVCLPNSEQG